MGRFTRCLPVLTTLFLGLTTVSLSAAPATGKYLNVVKRLQDLQAKYPAFAQMITIGTNDDGVDIIGIRISNSPATNDPGKAAHLIVGTHHGNEGAAPEFTLALVESLLKRYAGLDLFRTSLLETEWHIIPVLNISGYNAGTRNEKGQDPNRDYPGPCIKAVGGKLKSIAALMAYLKTRTFAGSLTVHGYLGALTYPWGVDVSNTHTQDHNAFDLATAKAAKIAGYRYGTSTDIVYPCDGAFEDYSYWKHGLWSLLLELESGSASDISKTVMGVTTYFDEIAASHSVKNTFDTECQRSGRMDLHIE